MLTDYVSAIPHDHSEAECSVRLLEYLGGQRAKQARKFQNLEQRYSSSLRRSLKRAWKTIDEIFPPKGDGQVKGKSLPAIVSASALTLLSELTRPSQLRKSNLHEYRLKVKELRNLFQMAQNSDQQPFVDELGDVKDAIGEWHDWEVLVAIANNVLDRGKDCRLVANLRKTTENKYQHALRLAQDMRRQDLRLSKPHANHSSKARPFQPAKRVWSATASLAA